MNVSILLSGVQINRVVDTKFFFSFFSWCNYLVKSHLE